MNTSYSNKTVLAIGAHPDDIEFGCGATMAMLSAAGAKLIFVVATDGNRGSRQHQVEKDQLIASRKQEQQEAGKILGASELIFLDEEDGNLIADLSFKEKVVRLIRQYKPDMVFTHDPTWHYSVRPDGSASVNHTDHRACGSAVLDAVYPLARDLQSFPHHSNEGITPHKVPELYLFSFGKEPNFGFDVTNFVDKQVESICAHKSQIDEPAKTSAFMKQRAAEAGPKYGHKEAETFTRLAFD